MVGTICVAALLAAVVCAIIVSMVRKKISGKSLCSCSEGCASCSCCKKK